MKKNLVDKIILYRRILTYLDAYEKGIKISSKKDKEAKERLKKVLEDKTRELAKLNIFLGILYVLVYFSLVNTVIPNTFLLGDLTTLIKQIISITGTGIFALMIFLIHKRKNLIYMDITLISSSIISILTKYCRRDNIEEVIKNVEIGKEKKGY